MPHLFFLYRTINIDFNKLILWLLPNFLRKPKTYAWLQTLCSPAVRLYGLFQAKRDANLYKLVHSSQVFSLQKVLNDRFDAAQRRIYITDSFAKDRLFIYTRAEDKPKHLGTLPLHNRSDYGDTGVDFIVWVPYAVPLTASSTYELKSLVDFYKLASKRYTLYRS